MFELMTVLYTGTADNENRQDYKHYWVIVGFQTDNHLLKTLQMELQTSQSISTAIWFGYLSLTAHQLLWVIQY